MNWFQRFGLPGTYFYGILILWIAAIYPCEFGKLINSDKVYEIATIIVGIIVASFLPIGYLITLIGQIIYHCVPGIGIDTRAFKIARINYDRGCKFEWKQEVIMLSKIIKGINRKTNNAEMNINKVKLVLEWMSRRMDMIVINSSLVLASILAFVGALLLSSILGCSPKPDKHWLSVAVITNVFVIIISLLSWYILTRQLANVEAEIFLKSEDENNEK